MTIIADRLRISNYSEEKLTCEQKLHERPSTTETWRLVVRERATKIPTTENGKAERRDRRWRLIEKRLLKAMKFGNVEPNSNNSVRVNREANGWVRESLHRIGSTWFGF